jgi:hypothetical protein
MVNRKTPVPLRAAPLERWESPSAENSRDTGAFQLPSRQVAKTPVPVGDAEAIVEVGAETVGEDGSSSVGVGVEVSTGEALSERFPRGSTDDTSGGTLDLEHAAKHTDARRTVATMMGDRRT